jgi:hypothetical protein
MPQIIYEKNAGELIPQGGRSVSTFPSGLVRVDQTFICSTPNVATHRANLKINESRYLLGRYLERLGKLFCSM